METLRSLFSLTVGVIFVVAALAKLRDPRQTAVVIAQYSGLRLGQQGSYWASLLLSACELVVGAGLILEFSRVMAWFAIGLLLLFTAFVATNIAKGRQIRCSCFGNSGGYIGVGTLLRNLLLLSFCALPAFSQSDSWRLFNYFSNTTTLDVFATVATATLLCLTVVVLEATTVLFASYD